MRYWNLLLFLASTFGITHQSFSQIDTIKNGYAPEIALPKVHKKRRNLLLGIGGTTYILGSIALYKSWYEDFPRSKFHFYNDMGEWRMMDKTGHVFSTYNQSWLAYRGWKWAGAEEEAAILSGMACGLVFQTTIEIMDGFSARWGFSWPDMASNILGGGIFVGQQLGWKEQRIRIKSSYTPVTYTTSPSQIDLINDRTKALYGNGFLQRWLKDYNGQTTWISANIHSFLPNTAVPQWLNVSLGYGAQNMLGGYKNQWEIDGQVYDFEEVFPRYSQWYISLDVDFSKIKTPSPFLRSLLDVLNVLKFPFSTLEINTLGEVKFHLIRF